MTQFTSVTALEPYLPPAIVQDAAFRLTIFNQPQGCVTVLVVSLAVLVVAAIIGALVFNRKQVA
jgi:ABC-2 type transport system permease protein